MKLFVGITVALVLATIGLAVFGGPYAVYFPILGFPAGLLTFVLLGNLWLGKLPR